MYSHLLIYLYSDLIFYQSSKIEYSYMLLLNATYIIKQHLKICTSECKMKKFNKKKMQQN